MNTSGESALWKHVWTQIELRLPQVPMQKADLYRESGISEGTFAKMRRAGVPLQSPAKRVALCRALGWSDDSIDRILRGESPMLLDQPDAAGRDYLGREVALSDAYIDRLTDVISRRAIGALAEQLRELSENLRAVMGRIERLERRGGEHGAR